MQKKTSFSRNKIQKRPSSCSNVSHGEIQANPGNASNKCDSGYVVEKPGKNVCKSNNVIFYRTRFFYNCSVKPKVIEASLARKSSDSIVHVKRLEVLVRVLAPKPAKTELQCFKCVQYCKR